jgi:hypothetical protein
LPTAFEALTGKDFGVTMLALVTGDDDNLAAVAAATPSKPVKTAITTMATQHTNADVAVLSNSLLAAN